MVRQVGDQLTTFVLGPNHHKANPGARVIMVTNYDDPALRDAAALAGACDYVLKRDLLDLRRVLLDLFM